MLSRCKLFLLGCVLVPIALAIWLVTTICGGWSAPDAQPEKNAVRGLRWGLPLGILLWLPLLAWLLSCNADTVPDAALEGPLIHEPD